MRPIRVFLFGYTGSGKTALFRSLTGRQDESFDPFTPLAGVGRMTDSRFTSITEKLKAGKVVPAEVEFFDCKGFPAETGFSEKSLRLLTGSDLILAVVPAYRDGDDPVKEAASLLMELVFADSERLEKIQQAWADDAGTGRSHPPEQERALHAALECLRQEKPLTSLPPAEKKALAGFDLLTTRPILVFVNGRSGATTLPVPHIVSDARDPDRESLYAKIKETLGLVAFFTVKGEIAQSWLVPAGIEAKAAAGYIHRDMEAGFIRAAVLPAEKFLTYGSWQKAKAAGVLKFLGPHSSISDGDVVEFYFHH